MDRLTITSLVFWCSGHVLLIGWKVFDFFNLCYVEIFKGSSVRLWWLYRWPLAPYIALRQAGMHAWKFHGRIKEVLCIYRMCTKWQMCLLSVLFFVCVLVGASRPLRRLACRHSLFFSHKLSNKLGITQSTLALPCNFHWSFSYVHM
jgi:hypothetical protein